MKACGKMITYQTIVEKILRTLSPKFDHIVVVIEESKKLEELKVEELQGSLEAHEQRLNERVLEKSGDNQVLFTKVSRRNATTIHNDLKGDQSSSGYQVHMAKEDDQANLEEQPIMLMMTTNQEGNDDEIWYIDSGCSNHITGHKSWLIDFDERRKSKVRFVDNRSTLAEGTSNIAIRRRDGGSALITEVMYVPGMKNNLIILDNFLRKDSQST
ncbi:PREDICTED: uncharacterized protein LOC109338587 [Lupinus angustifolius]|uniref:uncharacterized protein LOC109338587 n=1 Tax=Lupinus angustifolius TaxID=3871 RepID=UPI00092E9CB4|nr:PREDICTED: uncharacterized protein LOC109338587 [Lupinus angustifolius]